MLHNRRVGCAPLFEALTQPISCPICKLDGLQPIMLDEQSTVDYSHFLAGLVAFTCSLDHVFFLRYSGTNLCGQDLQAGDPGFSSTLTSLDHKLARLDDGLRTLETAKCISPE